MIANLENYRFTTSHEWVRPSGKLITVGISEHAQNRVSDIMSIELPEPDEHVFEAGEEIGVIDAVSGSVDIHAPIAGSIVSVNSELLRNPELVCSDPYGKGWLVKMKPVRLPDIEELMSIDQYEESFEDEEPETDSIN